MNKKQVIKFFKENWKIILALSYLALPIDLIPDLIPWLGVSDDILVLLVTLVMRYREFKKSQKHPTIQEGELVEEDKNDPR